MENYNEQKEAHDKLVKRSPTGYQYIYTKKTLKSLDKIIPKGKILDVGCGTGHYAEVLKDREWYGVDISPESIKKAKKHYKEAKVGNVTKHIPYPDNSFDHVLTMDFLHHVPNKISNVIKEIKRVLKPGGVVTIIEHDARNHHMRTVTSGKYLRLTNTRTERCLYPFEDIIINLLNNDFSVEKFGIICINADQQAFKPNLLVRIIKVSIIYFLDIFYPKRYGDFFVKAVIKKQNR
jgi:ubiquinone/menaquinone biosynthesis C-methylase UbiE